MALPSASFADTVYTDTTFSASAWLPVAFNYIHNNTSGANQSSVSYTTGPENCASCGFSSQGGLTFTTTSVYNGGGGNEVDAELFTGYINAGFTWNPGTQGALGTVSGTMEVSDTNTLAPGEPEKDQFDILILQGGNYYFTEAFVENGAAFNLVTQTPVTASSFFQFDPSTGLSDSSSHPNFVNGSTMEFGLFFAGGNVAPIPPFSETSTFSDLTLDLTAVPEPGSLALVAGALAGLAFLCRRKARVKSV